MPKRDASSRRGGVVVALHSTINARATRQSIWMRRLPTLAFTNDLHQPGVTHVVTGLAGASGLQLPAGVLLVTEQWLVDSARDGALRDAAVYVHKLAAADEGKHGQQQPQDGDENADPCTPQLTVKITQLPTATCVSKQNTNSPNSGGPLRQYMRWLGFWRPEFDAFTRIEELLMQAEFSEQRCQQIGNAPIAAGLRELRKFEAALLDSSRCGSGSGGSSGIDGGSGGGTHNRSHMPSVYGTAAAAVQACSFAISPRMTLEYLQAAVPCIGPAVARVVHELALRGGDCEQLERFRANLPVRSSDGMLRQQSAGAAAIRALRQLPGVGCRAAGRLYAAGITTLAQLHAAWQAGALPEGLLTAKQLFAVQHWQHLTEGISAADISAAQQVVAAAAASVTGIAGWTAQLVGGAARGNDVAASHDIDLLLWHPGFTSASSEQHPRLLERLQQQLVAQGFLVDPRVGFSLLQGGKMRQWRMALVQRISRAQSGGSGEQSLLDLYDHCFGLAWLQQGSRLRRLDITLVPHGVLPADALAMLVLAALALRCAAAAGGADDGRAACLAALHGPLPDLLPWAQLSWTGSGEFVRLLRRYVRARHMWLTPCGLLRLAAPAAAGTAAAVAAEQPCGSPPGGVLGWVLVPDEGPPLDVHGEPTWPPGWGDDASSGSGSSSGSSSSSRRRVRSESDIFSLLGLSYKAPAQRNCP